jgi:hypothetical protein
VLPVSSSIFCHRPETAGSAEEAACTAAPSAIVPANNPITTSFTDCNANGPLHPSSSKRITAEALVAKD